MNKKCFADDAYPLEEDSDQECAERYIPQIFSCGRTFPVVSVKRVPWTLVMKQDPTNFKHRKFRLPLHVCTMSMATLR
jgi:hypothetical protein